MKNSTLLRFVIIFSFSVSIIGQTHIWTGDVGDGEFSNPNNWDVQTAPNATSEVLISGDFDVTISGAELIENLTLENEATLFIQGELDLHEGALVNAILEITGTFKGANMVDIDTESRINFIGGEIRGVTLLNNGTIEVSTLANHTFNDVLIENYNLFKIFEANQVNFLSSSFLNGIDALFDIESNGGFTEASTTSILDNIGIIRKTPMAGGTNGNFYMILDVNNENIIEIPEDQTFLFLVASNTLNNGPAGVIKGEGFMDVTVEFINEGEVSPADEEVGTLDFTNTFNLSNNGFITVDLMSPAAGDFDQLKILGSPSLNGNIDVRVLQSLNIGDSFPVITWSQSGATCNFPDEVLATFGIDTYNFEVICNANDVTLVVSDILLGTDSFELDDTAFRIVPNPISETATFHFSPQVLGLNQPSIRIYNMLGQLISETKDVKDDYVFNRNNLPSGLYFAQILSEDKVRATRQLVLD